MSTPQMQERLHTLINQGDTRLVKMLYALAKEYTEEDFTLKGKPMTAKTLQSRVLKARDRVKSGKFTTQQDLEKELKSW